MKRLSSFRIVLVALSLIIGSYAFLSTLAEISSLDRLTFPSDPAKIGADSLGKAPSWLEVVSPFRSDLESNHAAIAALRAVRSGRQGPTSEENAEARARVKQTLSVAPYDPELWLVLALLESQRDPRDPTFAEALKMAYFTAPSDARLMPVRLDTATLYNALADPDLKELARGDVRLMLTRQRSDLKSAVVSAYRRASSLGKAFLEEAVQSIDPSFLPALRG